jgi:outer membrane protein OmpA-like peptidoglycan-associated protein
MQKKNLLVIKLHSSNGKSSFGVNCDMPYNFQVSKQGYESAVGKLLKSDGGEVVVEILMQPILPIITEKEVILQPIFFEFNKSNITQQGAAELDKLVQVMVEHPNMVIFAKSHTDNRGSDKYNMNLSDEEQNLQFNI